MWNVIYKCSSSLVAERDEWGRALCTSTFRNFNASNMIQVTLAGNSLTEVVSCCIKGGDLFIRPFSCKRMTYRKTNRESENVIWDGWFSGRVKFYGRGSLMERSSYILQQITSKPSSFGGFSLRSEPLIKLSPLQKFSLCHHCFTFVLRLESISLISFFSVVVGHIDYPTQLKVTAFSFLMWYTL